MLCTIAGFDPTGSAGWGVDLAVFEALGCRGRAVVTADTEQGPAGVLAVEPKKPASVARELGRVLAEDDPAALKTGMLATAGIVDAVAAALAAAAPRPLVVDPVLAAGAGGDLLEAAAIPTLAARLGPHATLRTPNRPEAARLLGLEAIDDAETAAQALRAAGWAAVLLKDGHGTGPDVV
ncbi:MAG: bifunctional hydroxymethylpyrimidine kinase/phosphomethylpyrimidine kinase, partial [Planctomycetota bacterium]|nr:bifunctional hydroxymethylpyrimidine kinase/phosphomethylpyrimidine kinase [Planctomycetota bacterium]